MSQDFPRPKCNVRNDKRYVRSIESDVWNSALRRKLYQEPVANLGLGSEAVPNCFPTGNPPRAHQETLLVAPFRLWPSGGTNRAALVGKINVLFPAKLTCNPHCRRDADAIAIMIVPVVASNAARTGAKL